MKKGLEKQGFVIKTFPWYEDQEVSIVRELVGEGPFGSDVPFQNATVVSRGCGKAPILTHTRGAGKISMAGRKGLLGA